MFEDGFFSVALQSSLILGLVHGVNPCGHSWLVLMPFVVGQRRGARIFTMTFSFLSGTALACLIIGFTLGMASNFFTSEIRYWSDMAINGIVAALGLLLLIKPQLLHSHDHEDGHHAHGHDYESRWISEIRKRLSKATGLWLFFFGFVNMIIPCPTVAVMYSYAIKSESVFKSVFVFGVYAFTTAMAVGLVIFAIYKISGLVHKLEKPWIESLLMRGAGALTLFFGVYSFWLDFV